MILLRHSDFPFLIFSEICHPTYLHAPRRAREVFIWTPLSDPLFFPSVFAVSTLIVRATTATGRGGVVYRPIITTAARTNCASDMLKVSFCARVLICSTTYYAS